MRAVFLVMLALAGCGVDGPPVPPESAVPMGISISGTVQAGIAKDGG